MIEGMTIIGENLNATRKAKVGGMLVKELGDDRLGIRYKNRAGDEAVLDLTETCQLESVQRNKMCPYLAGAVIQRNEEYLLTAAQRQVDAGADFLDVCVDEITPNPEARHEHMKWLVQTVQGAVDTPLCFDSSDSVTIRAALEVYDFSKGRPLINSTNLEPGRLELIPLAKETNSLLIANGSGETRMPENAAERVENLSLMVEKMTAAGLPLSDMYLDPLVLPVSTNNEHSVYFLEAIRLLREKFGPEVHLSGGISNVSFGLPKRKFLNLALAWLHKEAGGDSAMVDPMQLQQFETDSEIFQLACQVHQGKDEFCMNYITHCRS